MKLYRVGENRYINLDRVTDVLRMGDGEKLSVHVYFTENNKVVFTDKDAEYVWQLCSELRS